MSASLLRVSDFCRIPKASTERLKVRLTVQSRYLGQTAEPNSALVSDRFLVRASLIAGQVAWINHGSNWVAVRTILKEQSSSNDDDSDGDFDILEITPVVATNLGLLSELSDSLSLNDNAERTTTKRRWKFLLENCQ
jgi:hypothetical protein